MALRQLHGKAPRGCVVRGLVSNYVIGSSPMDSHAHTQLASCTQRPTFRIHPLPDCRRPYAYICYEFRAY